MTMGRLFLAILLVTSIVFGPASIGRGDRTGASIANRGKPCRGVAFLSSSIHRTVSAEEILDFVESGDINFVVIDFAWITHHWPRTDREAVERLSAELRKRHVEVAVMYRPRVLRPTEANIHYAVGEDGSVPFDHNGLCFSHEDSQAWGVEWGKKLLTALPSIDTVVLYNLQATCRCSRCSQGRGETAAAKWIERCRREWAAVRPNLRIGHVGMGIEYAPQVDSLYPFLPMIRDAGRPVDIDGHLDALMGLRSKTGGKSVVPLAKVCWESATNNTTDDVIQAVRQCDKRGSGFVLWHYDWIFHHQDGRYDRKAILTALGGDWDKVARHFAEGSPASSRRVGPQAEPAGRSYTAEEIRTTAAETFFERIVDVEEGWHRFSAMQALQEKARSGDAATRDAIVRRAIGLLGNRTEPLLKRWQCCYVLSGIGDDRAIPALRQALSQEEPDVLRGVAACALGAFDAQDARQTLEKARQTERNAGVLSTIDKALSGAFRKTSDRARPAPANEEPPPVLTFPYDEKAVEKLRWPHEPPGLAPEASEKLNRDVWVINNFPLYQADEAGRWRYFHGGLDIVLNNGTKIYAIKDGWVKSLRHSSVIIADAENDAACYGWQYTHLGNFQVAVGEFVKKGKWIGSIDFQGLAHLHLTKVFSEGRYWGSWSYSCAPDAHFAYVDEEPPVIRKPFLFFANNSDDPIRPSPSGTVTLRGAVDIVVGMRDGGRFAHSQESRFGDRLGVARIEYKIVPLAGDVKREFQMQSFDFRKLKIKTGYYAREYGTELTKVVYKDWRLAEPTRASGDKTLSYYVITNCPQGEPPKELSIRHRDCCWNTAESDGAGKPVFPDGPYNVAVTAFDFAGNSSTETMTVQVANRANN
jgi:murein DD-endopeptidase MepM/ murein hydrolase activator NlpD